MKISHEHVNGVDIITLISWFGLVSERYVHLTVSDWIKRERFDLVDYLISVETGQEINGASRGMWACGDAMRVRDFLDECQKKKHNSDRAKAAQALLDTKNHRPNATSAPPPKDK